MTLKVSVIIPAYNSEKTIVRALQSVFDQTRPPYEIIVIDDGSSDRTLEILNEYKEKISVFCQKNSGAAAARNEGVNKATGDLIAFLDSDDIWHAQKLEIQASFFEVDPDLDISSTGFNSLHESNYSEHLVSQKLTTADIRTKSLGFNKIFIHPFLATPTVIIKKTVFLTLGGFNESLITAEDVDLWLRSCFGHKYIYIENKLTWVVTQDNSLTARATQSPFLMHLSVIDDFCARNSAFAHNNKNTINTAKSLIYTCIGSSLLCQNKKIAARIELITAIKLKISPRNIYLFMKTFL